MTSGSGSRFMFVLPVSRVSTIEYHGCRKQMLCFKLLVNLDPSIVDDSCNKYFHCNNTKLRNPKYDSVVGFPPRFLCLYGNLLSFGDLFATQTQPLHWRLQYFTLNADNYLILQYLKLYFNRN